MKMFHSFQPRVNSGSSCRRALRDSRGLGAAGVHEPSLFPKCTPCRAERQVATLNEQLSDSVGQIMLLVQGLYSRYQTQTVYWPTILLFWPSDRVFEGV
jgi:hypothetical protein